MPRPTMRQILKRVEARERQLDAQREQRSLQRWSRLTDDELRFIVGLGDKAQDALTAAELEQLAVIDAKLADESTAGDPA